MAELAICFRRILELKSVTGSSALEAGPYIPVHSDYVMGYHVDGPRDQARSVIGARMSAKDRHAPSISLR